MISDHLPVLQVLVPLLAAPLCLLVNERHLAWAISTGLSLATLAIAAQLLQHTLADGVISYELGGWSAHWGIEYRVDVVNAFVLLVITTIGSVVLLYARQSVLAELYRGRIPLFYAMYMLCLGGLLGVSITGDVFNLFVFMEISSLSSYTLIALSQERRALTSAYQYLIMGTIGATFLLIGIGLMYTMTGTLNMRDLAGALPAVTGTRTIETAFAFIVVGVSIKLALVPLHLWLPNAYTYAPSAVTAFIASTATKVAFYVLLRFLFTIFGVAFAFSNMVLGSIFMGLALLAIFTGSTAAIFQDNVKRMLAYSSIAQIGFMILGVSLATTTGVGAAILHLFNHAIMKAALFLALGCVYYRLGTVSIRDMRGLGREMPWTMTAFVIGGFSLVGLPLTVGFISKWYLVLAALEQG
ncbi:MAG TPA: monovalent cation/H+ antiporter subunit D family protein, partial [Gammaproteobacteria bacterium]|nr:monovalent cation/H+ antiporter subunit D family protein [Gammaproteobacteria bacterium]